MVRVLSERKRAEVAGAIGSVGRNITTFRGEGPTGARNLVYALCARRDVPRMIELGRAVDPGLFYAVERFPLTQVVEPIFQPTGWRAVMKKK